MIQYEHPGSELAAILHRGEHIARAQQHLHAFISDLLIEGAKTGGVRDDVAPGELARYCLHAPTAARLPTSPWPVCARRPDLLPYPVGPSRTAQEVNLRSCHSR
jgi:hypothetical protein